MQQNPKTQQPGGDRDTRTSELAPKDSLTLLLELAAAGNEKALRTLLGSVTPKMLAVVRRVMGRTDPNVEDVAQEATFAFVRALGRFEGRCTVTHFACRIAVQTAMNARRAQLAEKRSIMQRADVELDSLSNEQITVEARIEQRRAVAAVRELIDTLPADQAEALLLHTALGFTVSEIAASAGSPQETIRSRLRLGRRALRRKLSGRPHLSLVKDQDGT